MREITHGMGKTGVKAGVISIGASENFTGLEEMVYRAAARAATRTGAAVITQGVQTIFKQLQILNDEGLDSSRIVISHLDSNGFTNLERDKQIARTGAYIAYDRIGTQNTPRNIFGMPDEDRLKLILNLLDAGLQDHILLSTSSQCQSLGWGESNVHSVSHLLRYFLPRLRKAGVDEATINTLLVENPRNVLTIQQRLT